MNRMKPASNGRATSTASTDVEMLNLIGSLNVETISPEESGQRMRHETRQAFLKDKHKRKSDERSAKMKERDETPRFEKQKLQFYLIVKIVLAAIALPLLAGMAASNAASRVIEQTQSLIFAYSWVGVFAMIGFGLEAYASKISKKPETVERIMAWMFVATVTTYLISFANNFAVESGLDLTGALLEGFDHRVLFPAQILSEAFLAAGFVSKIKEWLRQLRTPVISEKWKLLDGEVNALDDLLAAIEEELASLAASIALFDARRAKVDGANAKLGNLFKS